MSATSCSYFQSGSCRTCSELPKGGSFEASAYAATLVAKQKQLQDIFSKDILQDFVSSPAISGFRSKARYSFCQVDGEVQLGYYGENQSFHELSECPAHHSALSKLALTILKLIPEFNFSIFDIVKQSGELKNLILLRSETGSIAAKFVLRSPALKSKLKNFAKELAKLCPELKYVVMNLQPQSSSILEGEVEETLLGQPELLMAYNDLKVLVPSKSFSQVNSAVAAKLYHKASDFLREHSVEKALDLFCGAGGFLLSCQSFLKQGVGVELSKSSVRSANQHAESCSFTNLQFQALDLSESFHFDPILQSFSNSRKAVIVNPPRRGLGPSLSRDLNEANFDYLVYSSCSLESLIRDLKELSNYEIKMVQGFDMFPWTPHMEVLVGFARKAR